MKPQANSSDGSTLLRIPPHSIEAEQAVIGGLLISVEAMEEVGDLLPEDFYRRDHATIFTTIQHLAGEGRGHDVVTVGELLESWRQIDDVGGFGYLVSLTQNTPGASNIGAYANIVRKRARLRKLISTCTDITDMALSHSGADADEILDTAASNIIRLTAASAQEGPRHVREFIGQYLEDLDARHMRQGDLIGLPTGFTDLDRMTAGLVNGDLIIVAGRPSMGKTSLVGNIAAHLVEQKKTVLFFSLEQPRNQIIDRMVSGNLKINSHAVRTGKLGDADWHALTIETQHMIERNLLIDHKPAINPMYVRTHARKVQRQYGLDLIIVDYLQLMQLPKSENRVQEISEISRQLKAIAMDFNVPVIALSQLNRGLEQRPNKRPVMSDLRDSGGIEQDADVIAFIYRDEVYDEDSPDKGLAEIIIAKQRNGPIGKIKLVFQGEYMRFQNYAHTDAVWTD